MNFVHHACSRAFIVSYKFLFILLYINFFFNTVGEIHVPALLVCGLGFRERLVRIAFDPFVTGIGRPLNVVFLYHFSAYDTREGVSEHAVPSLPPDNERPVLAVEPRRKLVRFDTSLVALANKVSNEVSLGAPYAVVNYRLTPVYLLAAWTSRTRR